MIMSPLAISLDILQGEKMCFLGLVAPTIITLKHTHTKTLKYSLVTLQAIGRLNDNSFREAI